VAVINQHNLGMGPPKHMCTCVCGCAMHIWRTLESSSSRFLEAAIKEEAAERMALSRIAPYSDSWSGRLVAAPVSVEPVVCIVGKGTGPWVTHRQQLLGCGALCRIGDPCSKGSLWALASKHTHACMGMKAPGACL